MIRMICGLLIGGALGVMGVILVGVGHGTTLPLALATGPLWLALWLQETQSPAPLLVFVPLLYAGYGAAIGYPRAARSRVLLLLTIMALHYAAVLIPITVMGASLAEVAGWGSIPSWPDVLMQIGFYVVFVGAHVVAIAYVARPVRRSVRGRSQGAGRD